VKTSGQPAARPSAAERARRQGLWLVTVLLIGLTTVASWQILTAVFAPRGAREPAVCRAGIRQLLASVDRARAQAAARIEGERASLRAFRRALEPEWSHAAAIEADCRRQRDRSALAAFRQVELLRYAEERAVRYEALDLSLLRKRAPDLVDPLGSVP